MSVIDLTHEGKAALIVLLLAAAVIDVRQRRIPNWLTFPAIAAGFALWSMKAGVAGLTDSALGLLLGVGLFLPFYLARGMGAGDVKLMGAVGAFLGPAHAFYAALAVAIVGGLVAALVALRQGRLGQAIHDSVYMIFRVMPPKTLAQSSRVESIPYGLAIALGVLLYLIFLDYK